MPERSREYPQPISAAELEKIMSSDPHGEAKAAELVFDDLVYEFLDRNKEWPYKNELLGLLSLGPERSRQQEERLQQLVREEMGFSEQMLKKKVLETYANQNDYEITEQ